MRGHKWQMMGNSNFKKIQSSDGWSDGCGVYFCAASERIVMMWDSQRPLQGLFSPSREPNNRTKGKEFISLFFFKYLFLVSSVITHLRSSSSSSIHLLCVYIASAALGGGVRVDSSYFLSFFFLCSFIVWKKKRFVVFLYNRLFPFKNK